MATVNGTNGNDTLNGTDVADTIDGLAGNDTINAGSGDDSVVGGSGNDTISDGAGSDTVNGGTGTDVIVASVGAGNDVYDGGSGLASERDTVDYSSALAGVLVNLGLVSDQAKSMAGGDAGIGIDQLFNIESVIGSAFGDTLHGNSGNNSLSGQAGDDYLSGGAGNDTIDGGDGFDRANFYSATNGVNVSLAIEGAQDTGQGLDTLISIEALIGSAFGDVLTGSDGNDVLQGYEGDDQIFGGDGWDTITGDLGNDLLDGGNGKNTITGGDGDDVLKGGTDDDWFEGGAGIDTVDYSGAGAGIRVKVSNYTTWQITWGAGSDLLLEIENLVGSNFNDELYGDESGNRIDGGGGEDQIWGYGGDDYLAGGNYAADILYGGTGNDTLVANGGTLIEYADEGIDTVIAYSSWVLGDNFENLTLGSSAFMDGTGNELDNIIIGGDGWNDLRGLGGDDQIFGHGGLDELDGGGGADILAGGQDDDIYYAVQADDVIIEEANEGNDTIYSTLLTYVLADNVENLFLPGGGQAIGTGNDLANDIRSSVGHDVLYGKGGNDLLRSDNGNDVLVGGAGADVLDGERDSDIYMVGSSSEHSAAEISDTGVPGVDELRFAATAVAQTLTVFAGDTGLERVVIGTGTGASAVTSGLLAHNIDARAVLNGLEMVGNSGANTLYATQFADQLSGGNGVDRLYGYGDNDSLDGGNGADVMYGGAGNDTYVVGDASDAPIELAGEGTDTVLASVAHTLKANVEKLTLTGVYSINGRGNDSANILTGNSGSNRLWGEGGTDTLRGNEGNDQLDGGAGNDVLTGGAGNDIYFVDSAGDTVTELAGEGRDTVRSSIDYTLGSEVEWLELQGGSNINGTGNELANVIRGNEGDNSLSGLSGNDKLYAGGGNDSIDGGEGGDWLEGGAGTDQFTGGLGSDRFVFREGDFGGASVATADVIHDFVRAQGDKIHLSTVDANSTLDGNQSFAFLGTGAFTSVAGQLRYEQSGGNTFVQGDLDGDGIADFTIQLDGTVNLVSGDFLL